jgi:hypothetical protein
MNKLQDIIEEIKKLEKQLVVEIEKKEEEFFYKIKGKKIYFDPETRKYQKTLATRIYNYLADAALLNILTAPVIWFCLLPALFMDAVLSGYQSICFRIYGIPRVKRGDYIVLDRQSLSYLNPIEKVNCVYCGYFNGLIAYVQEIAARTEQYWCPIKHARKLASFHKRYHKFFDYGDHHAYKNGLDRLRCDFSDLEEHT